MAIAPLIFAYLDRSYSLAFSLGCLPTGEPCDYLYKVGKLTPSSLSVHSINVKLAETDKIVKLLTCEGGSLGNRKPNCYKD